MIVAADEAIPYIRDAFAGADELRLFGGRNVRPEDLRDVDALIVRSITRVDAGLLAGSAVRFVGTVSIGMDHLDLEYLADRGIHCANAAGSNAEAVAEYVVAALLSTARRRDWTLAGKTIAVIGVGNVGSRVARKATALGMNVMLCDPPLRESTGEGRYGDLEDVLGADILTLHVPLTIGGRHATRHMVCGEVLRRLSPRQFVINTSRGAVVAGADLKQALREQRMEGAVLDVWENEPALDRDLLDLVDIGTAHIAGSSLDGKVRGTAMILDEFSRCWKFESTWDRRGIFAPPQRLHPVEGAAGQDTVCSVVLQAYNILRDDANLRRAKDLPEEGVAALFDRLRNNYELRPEFSHFIVDGAGNREQDVTYRALGFEVADPSENANSY